MLELGKKENKEFLPDVIPALKQKAAEGRRPTKREIKQIIQKIKHEDKPEGKPLPNGKYNVILADPPWRYEFSETMSREIENNYPTMDLEAIKQLAIPSEDNAVLLMWVTAPKLEEGLRSPLSAHQYFVFMVRMSGPAIKVCRYQQTFQ